MTEERLKAASKYEYLKKQIFDLGSKAGMILSTLREETDTMLTDKKFEDIDFEKVEWAVNECKAIQTEFKQKTIEMEKLRKTYKF